MKTNFKKGDLVITKSRKEHMRFLDHVIKHNMRVGGVAWEDRYTDCDDGYNRLFYNGKKWKSFDKEDFRIMRLKRKTKRKFKAKKVLSFRTTYEGSMVKHRFF